MQRIAGDFCIKRSVMVYGPGGATIELYELPNGQWQIGKGKDAVVVTDMQQIDAFPMVEGHPVIDASTRQDIEKWVERIKHQPAPAPVQQGQTPLLAGQTARDRLSRAIAVMTDETVNRMLTAIEQTIGPVADSLTQPAQVNHHSDGFGQDQDVMAPGSVEVPAFQLPEGARWADPGNPAAGYLTVTDLKDDKNLPVTAWHPTPAFNSFVETATDVPAGPQGLGDSSIEAEMERARNQHHREDLVGAGGGRRSSRRR